MELYSTLSQDKEALLSAFLVNLIDEVTFCLKEDSNFIYVDEKFCRLLEYSRQEFLSLSLLDIAVDLSLETWLKQWQASQQNDSTKFQCRLQSKSKKIFITEIILIRAKEPESEFVCASIATLLQEILGDREITAKSSDLSLSQKISLLCRNFERAACGFLAVNLQGDIINCDRRFIEMWEIPESLIFSKNSQEYKNFFTRQLKNFAFNERCIWETSLELTKDSSDILELNNGRVFARYSKPQLEENKIIGRNWIIWDITEVKPLIQEPETIKTKDENDSITETLSDRAVEEAKALSELRTRFLSTMCHQFRSFLNVISFSNSLLRRNVNRETKTQELPYLDNIQTAVDQIGTLLDKLLFLGQSEVGRLKFEPKQTDIARFCRDLTTQVEAISHSKQQTIEFICQDNLNTACVDTDLLEQIIINLLLNAVKYTHPKGRIEFRLFAKDEELIFQIKDTGVGISKVEQQRIFEPFYRGSNIDDTSGMGLGLTIAKNLVMLHGGQIRVESQEGVGTTFTVTIPAS
jgi:signal transduction histidine kinase